MPLNQAPHALRVHAAQGHLEDSMVAPNHLTVINRDNKTHSDISENIYLTFPMI
jgi:hypothetical protein